MMPSESICRKGQRVICCCVLICLSVLGIMGRRSDGQTAGAGTINGTVTDSSGAVIPGANRDREEHGYGSRTHLPDKPVRPLCCAVSAAGHYSVNATAATFGAVIAKNLNLLVGQTLTVDLNLTVKSSSTTVEVSAEAPILDIEKTEVSQVVDQAVIQNLPVNGRNWSDFVLLTPNVVPDGGSGLVSFHGISGLYNQNYVDGANNNQMLFSEARGRSSVRRLCTASIRSRV